jgi:hypothetical protein
MIDILSAEMSDNVETNLHVNILDKNIKLKLTSILFHIVQQCSNKIFEVFIFLYKFKSSDRKYLENSRENNQFCYWCMFLS